MAITINLHNPERALQKIVESYTALDIAVLAYSMCEWLAKYAEEALDETGRSAANASRGMTAALVQCLADDAGVDGLTDEDGNPVDDGLLAVLGTTPHRYRDMTVVAEPIEAEAGGGFNLLARSGVHSFGISIPDLKSARAQLDHLQDAIDGVSALGDDWDQLSGPGLGD